MLKFILLLLLILNIPSLSSAEGLASVTSVQGKVQVQHFLNYGWSKLGMHSAIDKYDRIRTDPGAQIEITFADGTIILLDENSELQIKDISEDSQPRVNGAIFKLFSGRLFLNVDEDLSNRMGVDKTNFVVITPEVSIPLKKAECVIEFDKGQQTRVMVLSGNVQINDKNLFATPTEYYWKQSDKLYKDAKEFRKIILDSYRRLEQVKKETGYTGKAGKLIIPVSTFTTTVETAVKRTATGEELINVALITNGATATASSELLVDHPSAPAPANKLLDADVESMSSRWVTKITDVEPYWVIIDFGKKRTFTELKLFFDYKYNQPIKDYTLQYWDGENWKNIEVVIDNNQGIRSHMFYQITSDKVRMQVTRAWTDHIVRMFEFQVWGK